MKDNSRLLSSLIFSFFRVFFLFGLYKCLVYINFMEVKPLKILDEGTVASGSLVLRYNSSNSSSSSNIINECDFTSKG